MGETSPEAIACRALYAAARDTVQAAHPWDFCTEIDLLAETTNDRPDDWAYKYIMPTCLRFVRVWPYQGLPNPRYPIDYEIRGDYIYCNVQYARGLYVVSVEDPTKFSPSFVSALSFYLASELCMPLGKQARLAERMVDAYNVEIARAAQTDANQVPTNQDRMQREASWIEARNT
jgi:hypothetical protein